MEAHRWYASKTLLTIGKYRLLIRQKANTRPHNSPYKIDARSQRRTVKSIKFNSCTRKSYAMHVNSVPKKTPIPKAPSHRLLLGSSASWRFSFFGAGGGSVSPNDPPVVRHPTPRFVPFCTPFFGEGQSANILHTAVAREANSSNSNKKRKRKKQGAMKSFIVLRSGQICSCKALTNETQVRLYANQEVLRP